jgi:hypothetical protein
MQVRIEIPITQMKTIRIAIDLETQYAIRQNPQIIFRQNQNNRPTMDNQHRLQSNKPLIRREGERRRSNIAWCQYCNRLEGIALER